MRLAAFVVSGLMVIAQQYIEWYRERDLVQTLRELEHDYALPRINTWDFIVVGAGPAGCLLAERLSKRFTVLLLEKGGDPSPVNYNEYFIHTGGLSVGTNVPQSEFFESLPQTTTYQGDGGIHYAQVGSMMGGSGSYSYNVWNRGSPKDYDSWANFTGDNSWRYEYMINHFKAFENMNGPLVNENERNEYYANTGPFYVRTATPPRLQLWYDAAKEMGFPIADPNGYQKTSFAPMVVSIHNGITESPYDAFIKRKAAHRKTLTIHRYSYAEEILINENNKAYGVAYTRHGIPQIAHAKKEVVVSAGVFASPSLLIKSGIGPRDLLTEAGIPVRSDLPGVGENLYDNFRLDLFYHATNVTMAKKYWDYINDTEVEGQLNQFHNRGRGFYTQSIGPQIFLASQRVLNDGDGDWIDVQFDPDFTPTIEPNLPFMWGSVILLRSRSHGNLYFNATAFSLGERNDSVLIRPNMNYLSDPTDVDTLIEGINLAITTMEQTTPFKALGMTYNGTTPEACQSLEYRSYQYWACCLKYQGMSDFHKMGTCKMGNATDPMAVVDSKLRVKGIKNLRVIDSSIFPRPPAGNTIAPTMVVAQKGAFEILNSY